MPLCRYCGSEVEFKNENILTPYRGVQIYVWGVPSYICSNEHVELSPDIKFKLNERLKTAFEQSMWSIYFDEN